jgi:biopolymer transport protein ExbD
MSGSVQGGVKAEPNLTPVLDMVFQLITFFLLIINFKSAEIDANLKLPVVGSARPPANDPRKPPITGVMVLNIDQKGNVKTTVQISDLNNFFRRWADADRHTYNLKLQPDGTPPELPTIVVIRADKATPFVAVYHVIDTARNNGFRQFALKAAPLPKKKAGG